MSDPELTFQKELENLINRYSLENKSNSPDFILAEYLNNCLTAFNKATNQRSKYFGVYFKQKPTKSIESKESPFKK